MVKFIKQTGFSIIELLIGMAFIVSITAIAYTSLTMFLDHSINQQKLMFIKKELMDALNQYYINHYAEIQKNIQKYKTIQLETLIRDGYLENKGFYNMNLVYYKFGVRSGNPNQVYLGFCSKNPKQFSFLNPTLIENDCAVWFFLPQYKNIAGTLKLNAVYLARFYDETKM